MPSLRRHLDQPKPKIFWYRENGAPVHIYWDMRGIGKYKSPASKSTFTRYRGMRIISINCYPGFWVRILGYGVMCLHCCPPGPLIILRLTIEVTDGMTLLGSELKQRLERLENEVTALSEELWGEP